MKLTGTDRQTGGQDQILSQADALTKNTGHYWAGQYLAILGNTSKDFVIAYMILDDIAKLIFNFNFNFN